MSTAKEFRAKTVDQAIENACQFFAVDRDRLEIDIVNGGSTGIFGLGAKKATIRAKKRQIAQSSPSDNTKNSRPAQQETAVQLSPTDKTATFISDKDDLNVEEESTPDERTMLSPQDQEILKGEIQRALAALLLPISQAPSLTIDTNCDPISVHISDDQNSGLIIGRDGQTIAAIQYLLNRIIAKAWPGNAHIQLDAGDYRQKQQEQLQEMALSLSERARKSGKVQSTRPLSPFHRRLVHMALQNDRSVQTRSKGDGPMKRVLIVPVKRSKQPHRSA